MDNFFIEKIRSWWKEDKKDTRPWNWSVDVVTESKIFTYINGATGFLFTNTGADIVTVNNKILYPGTVGTDIGDSFALAAHKNDTFRGQIQIRFQTTAGPQLEIVQVYYMDVQQR